jgi:hypothetical protein
VVAARQEEALPNSSENNIYLVDMSTFVLTSFSLEPATPLTYDETKRDHEYVFLNNFIKPVEP